MSLHGKKGLSKKIKKRWHYDKILVHLKKNCTLLLCKVVDLVSLMIICGFGLTFIIFGSRFNEKKSCTDMTHVH